MNPISRVPVLDPGLAWDTDSSVIIELLFSGLVDLTPDLDVVPEVARTWEVLDGGRKYVFHLRHDACWSDGLPLTAHDFEFAWKRALDPQFGSPPAPLLYVIKGARAYHQGQVLTPQNVGVRALDDLTLAVELESPTGYFLHLLTYEVTYPVPRHTVRKHGPAWTEVRHLVGNGPFLLEDWQPNQLLTLSRNPSYGGRFGGNVQRIEVSVLNDNDAALKLYDLDRLDATWLPLAEIDEIRRRHAAEYMMAPAAHTEFIRFDVTHPPFDDARVRRAFTLAIDRDALANRILSGTVSSATGGLVPPGISGHSAGIGLAYDPERARQTLAEAGYPNGLNFPKVDLLARNPGRILLVEYLLAQWQANLGVHINQRIVDKPLVDQQVLELMRQGQVAMFSGGWLADYPDAYNFLKGCIASGTDWRNDAFDQLVETASHVSDQAKRMQMYQEADRILIEEAAVIPLTYGRAHLLVKPWISHFRLSPMRSYWKDVVIEPH